jgi:hypothetical protein
MMYEALERKEVRRRVAG